MRCRAHATPSGFTEYEATDTTCPDTTPVFRWPAGRGPGRLRLVRAGGLEIRISLRPASGTHPARSETRRGVPQTGQPGLRVIAFGDDSGDAPGDAHQLALHTLRHVVTHRSSSISGQLLPVTIEPRRKVLLGTLDESPICLLRQVLAGPQTDLTQAQID